MKIISAKVTILYLFPQSLVFYLSNNLFLSLRNNRVCGGKKCGSFVTMQKIVFVKPELTKIP